MSHNCRSLSVICKTHWNKFLKFGQFAYNKTLTARLVDYKTCSTSSAQKDRNLSQVCDSQFVKSSEEEISSNFNKCQFGVTAGA